MSEETASKGFVLSDLHMWSASSDWKEHLTTVEAGIAASDVVVFNGDIFDFKRSTFASSKETAEKSRGWLEETMSKNPDVRFYYVVGNHDHVSVFLRELDDLAAAIPTRFSVHRELLALGSNLFIHGDAAQGIGSSADLFACRQAYVAIEPNLTSIFLAKFIVAVHLNKVAFLTHPRTRIARNILRYLKHSFPEALTASKHIFFGHTHVPFRDFSYDGMTFTNTGSAIRHMPFAPAYFDVTPLDPALAEQPPILRSTSEIPKP